MKKQTKATKAAWTVMASAAAATVTALLATPQGALATIRINEVMLNAPGGNAAQDFIELKSTTGGAEAFDLTMVMLEGDAGAAGGVGPIDHFVQLTGTTGANGLFLRHSFSAAITPTPHTDTVQQSGGFGHENAAATWLLVSGFTGAVGTDLDTNDDGVLDAMPWTAVLDAVGSQDGDSNGDRTYAAQFGGADFNVNASSMPTPTDGKPEVIAFRDPNGAMHIASVMSTPAPTVGGPYPVTNGGLTVQTGYEASPGNENNPVTTGARAWIGAAGSSFNTGANWTGGAVPAAAGDVAMFDGGGANTLSLTADATAGTLSFNGGNHTINAGGGTLTLDTVTGNIQIMAQSGTPTVNAPIVLQKTTNLRAGRSTVTTLSNLNANGKQLNKSGIGQFVLANSATPGADLLTGGVSITSGSMKFASDGSRNRVLVAPALTMSGTTSRLDISDNKLITDTTAGVGTGGIYSGVQGMVQKGYANGAWTGQGVALITSEQAAKDGLTTLAVATGEQLGITEFGGQPVTPASTVVFYTYAGDTNFDGQITGDDYGTIDFSILVPGSEGYYNGDFNYDGAITGDDYGVIDFTIIAQGAPFPTSGDSAGLSSVSAVPEPSACGLALLGAASLIGARRRRT